MAQKPLFKYKRRTFNPKMRKRRNKAAPISDISSSERTKSKAKVSRISLKMT